MSTFDPMAAAIDWRAAYPAASLSIVDPYAELASLECACGGRRIMVGHDAITAYWGQRFREKPAGELVDLQHAGPDIVVGYRVPDGGTADQAYRAVHDDGVAFVALDHADVEEAGIFAVHDVVQSL